MTNVSKSSANHVSSTNFVPSVTSATTKKLCNTLLKNKINHYAFQVTTEFLNFQIVSVLCVPKGKSGEGGLTLFSHKIQTTGREETFMHFLFAADN